MNCPQCGAPVDAIAKTCRYCGEPLSQAPTVQPQPQPQPQPQQYQQPQYQQPMYGQPYQQPMYQQPSYQQMTYNSNIINGIDPSWPIKSKAVAGLLAIFLGGLGIHKFYLGKIGMGILYLCLCWTYIPEIVGVIEGIIYLCSNDHNFQVKNHVRLQ